MHVGGVKIGTMRLDMNWLKDDVQRQLLLYSLGSMDGPHHITWHGMIQGSVMARAGDETTCHWHDHLETCACHVSEVHLPCH